MQQHDLGGITQRFGKVREGVDRWHHRDGTVRNRRSERLAAECGEDHGVEVQRGEDHGGEMAEQEGDLIEVDTPDCELEKEARTRVQRRLRPPQARTPADPWRTRRMEPAPLLNPRMVWGSTGTASGRQGSGLPRSSALILVDEANNEVDVDKNAWTTTSRASGDRHGLRDIDRKETKDGPWACHKYKKEMNLEMEKNMAKRRNPWTRTRMGSFLGIWHYLGDRELYLEQRRGDVGVG